MSSAAPEPIAVFTLLGDETFSVAPGVQALFAAHSLMLATYRAGSFAQPQRRSRGTGARAPDAPLHVRRLPEADRKAQENPPQQWDGVFTAEEK